MSVLHALLHIQSACSESFDKASSCFYGFCCDGAARFHAKLFKKSTFVTVLLPDELNGSRGAVVNECPRQMDRAHRDGTLRARPFGILEASAEE